MTEEQTCTNSDYLVAVIAIILPPLAVALKKNICSADTLINLVLCCLGYFPGLLHAWYIITVSPSHPVPDEESQAQSTTAFHQRYQALPTFTYEEHSTSTREGGPSIRTQQQIPYYGSTKLSEEQILHQQADLQEASENGPAPPSYAAITKVYDQERHNMNNIRTRRKLGSRKNKTPEPAEDKLGDLHAPPVVKHSERSKAGDILKRRYSSRVYPAPLPKNAPFARELQASNEVPNFITEEVATQREAPGVHNFDLNTFSSSQYSAEHFITSILANAPEEGINKFYERLLRLRDDTTMDMQVSVFSTYNAFVQVSKEVSNLDTDMQTFRKLLDEFKNMVISCRGPQTDEFALEKPTGFPTTQRRGAHTHRNSIADLEVIYSNQLRSLWKRVDGSQSHLPISPGRHVILESGGWVELHPATWKAKNAAHLILLNDHILAAYKVHSTQSLDERHSSLHYVVGGCWGIEETDIGDIGTHEETDNIHHRDGIFIKRGREYSVFVVADVKNISKKAKLVENFRAAKAEHVRNHAERSLQKVPPEEPRKGQRNQLADYLSRAARSSGHQDRSATSSPSTRESKDFLWLQGRIDELDVQIAHRDSERAVQNIEKAQQLILNLESSDSTSSLTSSKLEDRAQQLSKYLLNEISYYSGKKTVIQQNVAWLARLGLSDLAREQFLKARSAILKSRVRQVKFTGDLGDFLTCVTMVYFIFIRNTFEIYHSSFSNTPLSSGFVSWANEHINDLRDFLIKQLHGLDRSSALYEEMLGVINDENKILLEVGLDFGYVLNNLIQ